MRLASRLRDATRSPSRLWWFGVRAVGIVVRGELPKLLARMRAASPDAAAYRAFLARHPAPVPVAHAAIGEVRLDVADAGARERLAVEFAAALPGVRVLVRDDGGWRPRDGEASRRGPWTMLVGDDLAIDAASLLRFEAALAALPDAVAAYADYDHRDGEGQPERPVLQSAWDAEQAFERPFCGPLLALRGGAALESALRAPVGVGVSAAIAELAAASDPIVAHVPERLFTLAQDRDDEHHVERGATAARRRGASVERVASTAPRLRFAIPPQVTVSVVVPTRDRASLLRACIGSVPATLGNAPVEIVVVDNDSTEPALAVLCDELVRTRAARILAQPIPFNFATLCNAGARAARGEVLVFLNNDARFAQPDALAELVALAARPWTGAVGPWLWYEDGRVQSAGVLLGVNRTGTSALAGHAPDDPAVRAWAASRRRVSAAMGACLVVERRKFAAVGGFDEEFAVSHNEVDLCLRLERAGFANVVTPYARVVHAEGASRGFEVAPAERARLEEEERRFLARWGPLIARVDPAHHPWLARTGSPFDFRGGAPDRSPRLGWHHRHG